MSLLFRNRRVKFFPVPNLSRGKFGIGAINLPFLVYVQVYSTENDIYAHVVIISVYKQGPDVGKRVQNFEENGVWNQKFFFLSNFIVILEKMIFFFVI